MNLDPIVSVNRQGERALLLKGSWTDRVEAALAADDWETLSIFGVDWPDYTPLIPFASRIRKLVVPLGPDSGRGLSELTSLRSLELLDAPKPGCDFRDLQNLRHLEVLWTKKTASFLAHEALESLIVHDVGGEHMDWIPGSLKTLVLKGGRVLSMSGLRKAHALESLKATGLKKCSDIADALTLRRLVTLEIDAPLAPVDGLTWISEMHELGSLALYTKLQSVDWASIIAHPKLSTISINTTAQVDATEEQIAVMFQAAGKSVGDIKIYRSKTPGVSLTIA